MRTVTGVRYDATKLDAIISRIRTKLEPLLGPDDDELRARWENELHYARIGGNSDLLDAFARFVSDEHSDPRSITIFLEELKGGGTRCYRKLSSMTAEHLDAFWMVRTAIYEYQRTSSNRSDKYRHGSDIFNIVFDTPATAPMICAFIRLHGIVSRKTMRGLLSGVDARVPVLAGGVI